MTRRALTLVVGSVVAAALAVVAAFVHVPYVVLEPGPTYNTLGANDAGQTIIDIKGARTYPTSGHLNLLTVSVNGGPLSPIRLYTAIRGWFDPNIAVVPQSEIYPPGQNPHDVEREDILAMLESQDDAATAALRYLHYSIVTEVRIEEVKPHFPAATVLRSGDAITAIDGQPTPATTLLQ